MSDLDNECYRRFPIKPRRGRLLWPITEPRQFIAEDTVVLGDDAIILGSGESKGHVTGETTVSGGTVEVIPKAKTFLKSNETIPEKFPAVAGDRVIISKGVILPELPLDIISSPSHYVNGLRAEADPTLVALDALNLSVTVEENYVVLLSNQQTMLDIYAVDSFGSDIAYATVTFWRSIQFMGLRDPGANLTDWAETRLEWFGGTAACGMAYQEIAKYY